MAVLGRLPEFKSPLCRLSYASGLFEARAMEGSTAKKYTATLIFPKSDLPALEAQVAKLIMETPGWGAAAIEKAKKGLIKSPFLAGDGKEARNKKTGDISPGMGPEVFFIRVQSGEKQPPKIIWRDPKTDETEENVYSGCYGKAQLNLFAWNDKRQGDGVSFGISGFQKHREGERLGVGRTDPEKWAETIEDDGPAPEETRTGQGAAGLFGA